MSILLALAAAIAWGVSDFMGGLFARRIAIASVLLVSQAVGFTMLVILTVLLRGAPTLDLRAVLFAMGASAAGMVGIAALYRGMAVGMVSIVAPISATGAAVPVVFGLLRGEHAAPSQLVGIGGALVGIVLASMTTRPKGESVGPVVAHGVGLAILAAVAFGGFFILLHEASTIDVLWASTVQRLTGVSLVALAAVVLRSRVVIPRSRLPGLVAVGVLDTGANVFYAFASTSGLVSIAAVLASLFPVVTVILARIVLRERLGAVQACGVVLALTGVVLIAWNPT